MNRTKEAKIVKIKPFTGGQQEFSAFKETFIAAVCRNFSDPEKLIFLKLKVEGEPLELIKSNKNYTVALEILQHHYGRT